MRHLKKILLLMVAVTILLCGITTTSYAKTISTSITSTFEKTQGFVNVKSRLNVREEANVKSKSLEKLEKGTVVTVLDETKDGWYKISYEKITGYVMSKYIILSSYPEYDMKSAYVTVSKSSENRDFNMAKAAELINGTIVESGEKFDWFEIVGSANKANGYKEATIISGGKYVLGYGGGICQVSTTIYNLINQLDIVPDILYHHSKQSSYVPKGMDATVAYPSKNFVFTNSTDYSIMIEVYTDGGTVYGAMYEVKEGKNN